MFFKNKFWLSLVILFLGIDNVEAQQHHFTNPQVRVQVTQETLNVSTTGYPDHKWEKVNPNRPEKQNFNFQIPRYPKIAPNMTPVPSRGPIAVAVNGVVFFGPEDREGKIALGNHGLDSCRGHPAPSGVYHYHCTPGCVYQDAPNQHSPVIGYAFDGFKIYGLQGQSGITPKDLDQCNGHTDEKRGYHYHTTEGFPFVLGCYRGTPALANYDRQQQRPESKNEARSRRGGDPIRQYCDADRKKYCPNMPPSREMMQCMMRNQNHFSPQCQQALKNHRPPGRR
ncbi:MAG: YHYH protein [Nitrospinae bacterium]|nr:YHYH protein [Nitrospinota bacterium]